MSETEYPTLKLKIAREILDPCFKYLYAKHISIFIVPLLIISIYAYFLFRSRSKGKKLTVEEIIVVIGLLFCLFLGTLDQYDIIMKMLHST